MDCLFFSGLISIGANAASDCKTLPECGKILEQVNARIREIFPEDWDTAFKYDINADFPKFTSFEEAKDLCAKKKMRLPTARELAEYAQVLHNVEGISTSNVHRNDGYVRIDAVDSAGKQDTFWYSHYHYYIQFGYGSSTVKMYSSDFVNGKSGFVYALSVSDGRLEGADVNGQSMTGAFCINLK